MAARSSGKSATPTLLFVTYIPIEALLVAFDIPGQIPFQLGFGFPKPIPACSDDVSVFFPGYLSLLPPPARLLFVFELCQELLSHPHRPSVILSDFLLIRMDVS